MNKEKSSARAFLFLYLSFPSIVWGDNRGVSLCFLFFKTTRMTCPLQEPIILSRAAAPSQPARLIMEKQKELLREAKLRALKGEELSELAGKLDPEYFRRLVCFIKDLPSEVANLTIFGKAHWNSQSDSRKKKKR